MPLPLSPSDIATIRKNNTIATDAFSTLLSNSLNGTYTRIRFPASAVIAINSAIAQNSTIPTSNLRTIIGTITESQLSFPSVDSIPPGRGLSKSTDVTSVVFAGLNGSDSPGFVPGTGTSARIGQIFQFAFDSNGNLYGTNFYQHNIIKITPDGVVTSFAGNGTPGYTNGDGDKAQFYGPLGITIDTTDTLYVSDINGVVRTISPNRVVKNYAGSQTNRIGQMRALAIDPSTNVIYTNNYDNGQVLSIRDGSVSVIATIGSAWACAYNPITGNIHLITDPDGDECVLSQSGQLIQQTYVGRSGGLCITSKATFRNNINDSVVRVSDNFVLASVPYTTSVGVCGDSVYVNGYNSIYKITLTPAPLAWTFTPHVSNLRGAALASSSDGTRLFIAANNEQIYTSADSGDTWTARESVRFWYSIACSPDGKYVIAGEQQGGNIHTSSDFGVTWTQQAPVGNNYGVGISGNGQYMLACRLFTNLVVSKNSGSTWEERESFRNWQAADVSNDGRTMVAVASDSQVFVSTDYGDTWGATSPTLYWVSVSCSSDGSKILAGSYLGGLYISTDSGTTWSSLGLVGKDLAAVAISGDGMTLAAAAKGDYIYVKSISDSSWTQLELPASMWSSITLSYDGTQMAVNDSDTNFVYTGVFE